MPDAKACPRPCAAVSALEISPGRLWLEARGPGAGRIVVDFELSSTEAPPRALLLAAAASDITPIVLRAGGPAGWQPVEAREIAERLHIDVCGSSRA